MGIFILDTQCPVNIIQCSGRPTPCEACDKVGLFCQFDNNPNLRSRSRATYSAEDGRLQYLLSGVLNVLKYNSEQSLSELVQVLRRDRPSDEVAEQLRRNLSSVQDQGHISRRELDELDLAALASRLDRTHRGEMSREIEGLIAASPDILTSPQSHLDTTRRRTSTDNSAQIGTGYSSMSTPASADSVRPGFTENYSAQPTSWGSLNQLASSSSDISTSFGGGGWPSFQYPIQPSQATSLHQNQYQSLLDPYSVNVSTYGFASGPQATNNVPLTNDTLMDEETMATLPAYTSSINGPQMSTLFSANSMVSGRMMLETTSTWDQSGRTQAGQWQTQQHSTAPVGQSPHMQHATYSVHSRQSLSRAQYEEMPIQQGSDNEDLCTPQ